MTADPLVAEYRPVLMNDAGQVVSVNDGAPGGATTILWDPATPDLTTTIPGPAGSSATPLGLTDDGSILFTASDGSSTTAYLWRDGVTTAIADPAYVDPNVRSVNPATGQVVGTADGGTTGFTWTRTGGFVTLACASPTAPIAVAAVDRSGYAVGSCGLDDGAKDQNYEPVVWSPTASARGWESRVRT